MTFNLLFPRGVLVVIMLLAGHGSLCAQDIATRKPCLPPAARVRTTVSPSLLSTVRPVLDTFVLSAYGRFRIHYSVRGTNAVSSTDLDADGVPDYIDSVDHYLERVYDEEVTVMGYRKPLPYDGDSSAWDVYVMEIGDEPGAVIDGVSMSGYYGLTYPVDARPQECDMRRLRTAAFLVLDNDYSPMDSVTDGTRRRRVYRDTGMLALKVTIAHEFHHMIQYAYASDLPSSMMNEMTGVWMEHRLFPESLDYLQYMKPLFLSTDTRYWTDKDNATSAGYAHAFFFQYLQERGKDSLVRRMWDLLGDCVTTPFGDIDALTALDSACRNAGSTLASEWRACLPLLYATGYRWDRLQRPFSNAAVMPVLIPFNNAACTYSEPSLSTSFSISPYQFRLVRCVLPSGAGRATDTVDVLYSVTSIASRPASAAYTVSSTRQTDFLPLGSTGFFYERRDPAGAHPADTMFFSDGFILRSDGKPFPQPYRVDDPGTMNFPVPADMWEQARVRLSVLTPDGVVISAEDREVILDARSRSRVVTWSDVPQGLSTGVYVYVVETSSARTTGTFLVQR
ncbi:MAG: MXAN_6640 family putative metalloprotease [Candidatus Kapaibacterium sp.]